MTDDPAFYERALNRMMRLAVGFGLAAVIVFLLRSGLRDAFGCAVGAVASILNLRWWRRLVSGIDPNASGRTISAVFLGLRYLILGAICFVIIRFLGVSLLALVAGLLISVAAVLAEIIYELVFTR